MKKIFIFDRDEQKRLIAEYHNSLIGGTGIKRCISKICEKYYCKEMKYETKKYVSGFKPETPIKLTKSNEITYTYDDYATEFKNMFKITHQIAAENLVESRQVNKKYYDKRINEAHFKRGDLVLVNKQDGTKMDRL